MFNSRKLLLREEVEETVLPYDADYEITDTKSITGWATDYDNTDLNQIRRGYRLDGGTGGSQTGAQMRFNIHSKAYSWCFWLKVNKFDYIEGYDIVPIVGSGKYTINNTGQYLYFSKNEIIIKPYGIELPAKAYFEEPLEIDTWYHFVVTFSGVAEAPNVAFYKDGVELELDSSLNFMATYFKFNLIGCSYVPLGESYTTAVLIYLDGNISDTAIYKRQLSSEEVATVYNNNHSFNHQLFDNGNLLHWWRMGDGPLDQFPDSTDETLDLSRAMEPRFLHIKPIMFDPRSYLSETESCDMEHATVVQSGNAAIGDWTVNSATEAVWEGSDAAHSSISHTNSGGIRYLQYIGHPIAEETHYLVDVTISEFAGSTTDGNVYSFYVGFSSAGIGNNGAIYTRFQNDGDDPPNFGLYGGHYYHANYASETNKASAYAPLRFSGNCHKKTIVYIKRTGDDTPLRIYGSTYITRAKFNISIKQIVGPNQYWNYSPTNWSYSEYSNRYMPLCGNMFDSTTTSDESPFT